MCARVVNDKKTDNVNVSTTEDLIKRHSVSRSTLIYWRGIGTVPKKPAATWGILKKGRDWYRIGKSVAYTADGEKVVKRMAKATRMPIE